MKKVTLYFLPFIFLLGCVNKITCQREFVFINKSQDSIIVGSVIPDPFGNCVINNWDNAAIPFNGQIKYQSRSCLEGAFEKKDLEFYVIDPNNFNDEGDFYPCDSIEFKNTILKKYSLSSDDLESMNWTITYP